MAFWISAAVATSGAVPHLPLGAHAGVSSAAAAAVAKGTRRSKGGRAGSKSMHLAQAAATAVVAAVQQAKASQLCSALPPFPDNTSVRHLWQLWKHGGNGKASLGGAGGTWQGLVQGC
jgi:hypothetical protein